MGHICAEDTDPAGRPSALLVDRAPQTKLYAGAAAKVRGCPPPLTRTPLIDSQENKGGKQSEIFSSAVGLARKINNRFAFVPYQNS